MLSNGTSALYLLGKALGWKKNDVVATTPISFLASSNCIVNNNATPLFTDIDKKNYLIDPNKLEDKLKKKKIKAVIAVDYAGHPCDWKALKYLSKKYNFILINDACHSMGSKYFSEKKYAIKYADFVSQSYHPVKAFTTGEGGSIISNNKKIIEKIKLMRNHSMIKNSKKSPWQYKIFLRTKLQNYRYSVCFRYFTIKKLDNFVSERRKIAKYYINELKNFSKFILPKREKHCKHSFHLFPLQIKFNKLKINKKELFKKIFKKRYQITSTLYSNPFTTIFKKKTFLYKQKRT